ncbi:MAG: glycoside hydrolase family 15 [Candidatus Kaiserbacteria bacterium]|nr:glycoside hydrolase family 15 [Candidatus Kaiserbacteria bacterium]
MSRALILSNGELAVSLDERGEVRDIYYPHVGLEDHVRGHYLHRIGVWIEGRMSWFSEDAGWNIRVSSETDALASSITAIHDELRVELVFKDIIHHKESVFLRRVSVRNLADHVREIKLYFAHQFEIYKSHGSDTAYFDPVSHALIHYKGHRVFLMGATLDGVAFQDYATGRANFQGKEGTHRDADDGKLSQNPIEHGPADSVFGLYGTYAPRQSRTAYYWMVAAQSIADAQALNGVVTSRSPEQLIKAASSFWNAWVNANTWNAGGLSAEHLALFKRSLMFSRAHVDNDGGIIASLDSDMLQYGLDTYSYVWPRDSAYIVLALDSAGDTNVSRRFFEFCRDVITDEGYFMHKYLPDKSLGSSWHPWIRDGKFQLPIQEDETALVIYAFYEHYKRTHDLEFLQNMFNPLIERAANFLVRYRDPVTNLPEPSYDLWERKRGSSTFTCCTVYGALVAAAELSKILGKDTHEEQYRKSAEEVREAILKHLWDEKSGMFLNMIHAEEGTKDATIDMSSVYGIFSFGILPADDPKLARAFESTVRTLSHGIHCGGIARFQDDDYYRIDTVSTGNPWMITTLWYAEYLTARAKTPADLKRVRDIFTWTDAHAAFSGALSEQLHPQTGEQVGATPLTWSHAAYVSAVIKYLDKAREIGV